MKKRAYTKEELEYLEAGYKEHGIPELTMMFNETFDTDKTEGQIRGILKRYGFRCGRSPGDLLKQRYKLMTSEQAQWLRDHYLHLSRKEICSAFNENFGTNLKLSQIIGFLKNNKIKSGRTGHWGTKPGWNAGTAGKGICKPNSGSFKPGSEPVNKKPLYTERINRDGYVEIKIPQNDPYTGRATRYLAKHRWVYEQHHGEIPKGKTVVFKDGDRRNFDPENLVAITRRQLSLLNIRDYFNAPNELKGAIWALVVLEAKTIGLELSDGSKSQKDLVLESIMIPGTSRDIAERTGIKQVQVCTILYLLNKQGKAKVVGTAKRNNRPLKIWSICNSTAEQEKAA
ncbi:HNH endonuclease signature motif containing protein [Neptuniibacter halophilus]|uniref:HNH endonuclease signature motif containing protein n=1 Tax=Neptuniibacter halophilus TaxID=651666 RepID=UPI0025733B24|nr:HNH endonuclease signature motif containing protein [Neptuniibacter halophilus]